jgi:LDH2 family malate/lactate/ureidoglycolate dehydrogenase
MALDISAFMEPGMFIDRVDRSIDAIKACRKRPGVEEILIPGEPEHRKFVTNSTLGVPVGDETVSELAALCQELNIPFALQPVSS